jgi:hypothetical protein
MYYVVMGHAVIQKKKTPDLPRSRTLRDLNRARKRHCFGPPGPFPCSGITLFKNSGSARRKCGGAPAYMNGK